MTADGIILGLRIYTMVVTVLVAIIGTCQIRRWRSYLVENQLAWIALAFLNLSAFFGTVQSLYKHIPGGTRGYVLAVAVTFELYAVCYPPAHSLWQRWQARRFIHTQIAPKE